MKQHAELRYFAADLRAVAEDKPKIMGYAVKWNSLSADLGGFKEVIVAGALTPIENVPVTLVAEHNDDRLLGTQNNGSLRFWSDEIGLAFEATPPDTATTAETLTLIRDEFYKGCSFKMFVEDYDWTIEGDQRIRRILKASLAHLSVVAQPAYPDTEVALRSLQEWEKSQDTSTPLLNRAKRLLRIHEITSSLHT